MGLKSRIIALGPFQAHTDYERVVRRDVQGVLSLRLIVRTAIGTG